MKKDLNWYLKWIATVILIAGTAITNLEIRIGIVLIGPFLLSFGGIIWLIVSIRWREASLIVTNGVMVITGLTTLAYKYLVV
jgi:hypothetical protein